MNVSKLADALQWKLLTDSPGDAEVTGGYTGDLLSWVMGRLQTGEAWITIMSSVNIVAVASLAEAACIVLAEGVTPEQQVIDKANQQGVVIYQSGQSGYEIACAIGRALQT